MVSMGRDLRLRSTPSRTVPSRDENPVTATPFIPTLTNRDARNPFRFRSYANTGVSPAFSSRRSRSFVALHFPKSFKCNTYGPPACVANKRLTPKVNPLDATLTKNRGSVPLPSFQFRFSSFSIPDATIREQVTPLHCLPEATNASPHPNPACPRSCAGRSILRTGAPPARRSCQNKIRYAHDRPRQLASPGLH